MSFPVLEETTIFLFLSVKKGKYRMECHTQYLANRLIWQKGCTLLKNIPLFFSLCGCVYKKWLFLYLQKQFNILLESLPQPKHIIQIKHHINVTDRKMALHSRGKHWLR